MDNRYFNYKCPPLMQDARFITNYTKNSSFEQYIRNINQIDSAQEYKQFLQYYGDEILNKERAYLQNINTCVIHGKCVPMNGTAKDANTACGCACKH